MKAIPKWGALSVVQMSASGHDDFMEAADVVASIAARIRARRDQLGLSQEQVAEIARMDRTAIGKIERCERGMGLVTLWRISKALDTTMADLLEGLA